MQDRLISWMIGIAIGAVLLAILVPALENHKSQPEVTIEGSNNAVHITRTSSEGYYFYQHRDPETGVLCYVVTSKHSPNLAISCVGDTP